MSEREKPLLPSTREHTIGREIPAEDAAPGAHDVPRPKTGRPGAGPAGHTGRGGRAGPSARASPTGRGERRPDPDSIGHFPVTKRLGRGGMGDVFLAYDETLSRHIAVKRIRPDRIDKQEARKRFEIEARVTGMLQHPSIVPVYEYFERGRDRFYTMRPIEGVTLRELLDKLASDRQRALEEWSTLRLVRLFLQAANAVAYAHSKGVVHRDLKPANIMVGPFEEILILDWGMAKVLSEHVEAEEPAAPAARLVQLRDLAHSTASDYLVGTPVYMAPEQRAGAPASFASDVYALGIILYELLGLRLPWRAHDFDQLTELAQTRPDPPSRLQPGRGIPAELDRVVLKALEHDPLQRYASVSQFAKEVASAMEGRAPWRVEPASRSRENWRLLGGRLRTEQAELVLRSRGPGGLFQLFCGHPFTGDVRVDFDFKLSSGSPVLYVWLNADDAGGSPTQGYQVDVIPGKRRTLSLYRSGRYVAGAPSLKYERRRWYRCSIVREKERFTLRLDGDDVYEYHDPIPLAGSFVGISGQSDGHLRLRNLAISTLGTSATVSCLAVPDAFFHRRLYEQARAEYERIAASHPGRQEGRLAGFRSGLCTMEMAEQESDEETRLWLYSEAAKSFSDHRKQNDTCLLPLGAAMVAEKQQDWEERGRWLALALEGYRDDPHRSTVYEWILERLHSAGLDERLSLAHLLQHAVVHCTHNYWGRLLVRDLVKEARRNWENPSFMTGRGRFRESDPVSVAEAKVYFAFWTANAELVQSTVLELAAAGLVRAHHVSDGTFALVELGRGPAAAALVQEVGERATGPVRDRIDKVIRPCRVATLAATGEIREAETLLGECVADPRDRVYNSARLALARGLFAAGEQGVALQVLRPLIPQDGFAREYQARFYLQLGEIDRADEQLQFFLDRKDHRRGRNLSNFLHGVSLIAKGHEAQAKRVFRYLEPVAWPRTWTLGSHYALGRLGGGDVARYVHQAFPWERTHLVHHVKLLAQARGESPEAAVAALRVSS